MFKQFPIYEKVKDRKQVILLGDSLWDVNMVNTHHFDVMLKVWFLNQNEEKRLDIYLEYYDVVVTQDGTLEYVNKILSEILC